MKTSKLASKEANKDKHRAVRIEQDISRAKAAVSESPEVQHTFFSETAEQIGDVIKKYGDEADFVTSLARGLAAMQALAQKRRHMSIAQVSQATGIPRAAARRSLHTLARLGFVATDESYRFYLRPKVLAFSHAYLSASPLALLSQQILDRLGENLQQGCSLAVLDGTEIVYLSRSSSSKVISPLLNVGRRLPAYCTSIGRVLLANLSEVELEEYMENVEFFPHTEYTIVEPNALRAELQEVRRLGYAFCSEQIERRLASLAVPVRNSSGQTVAGINLLVQGRQISAKNMAAQYFEPLYQASTDLGRLLVA